MNNQDIDDLKAFIYLLVQKSVDYELKPKKCNLDLLRYICNNFYMCLPQKARKEFRVNFEVIFENIKNGLFKLDILEKKQQEKLENEKPLDIYLAEKELQKLKRGL